MSGPPNSSRIAILNGESDPPQNDRVRCSDSIGRLGMRVSGDCFHLSAAAATEKGDARREGEESKGIGWSS